MSFRGPFDMGCVSGRLILPIFLKSIFSQMDSWESIKMAQKFALTKKCRPQVWRQWSVLGLSPILWVGKAGHPACMDFMRLAWFSAGHVAYPILRRLHALCAARTLNHLIHK